MGTLLVHTPGPFSSLQDLGQEGWSSIGLPRGGAADPFALRIGNRLLGNPDDAPAIEMTSVGGVFDFDDEAVMVLAGSAMGAEVHGPDGSVAPAQTFQPRWVAAGTRVMLTQTRSGFRAYFCIAGGVGTRVGMNISTGDVSLESSDVLSRRLCKGDRVEFGTGQTLPRRAVDCGAARALFEQYCMRREIRAVEGVHTEMFASCQVEKFWASVFGVSRRSDRAGIRLEGAMIAPRSEPVPGGAGRMESEGMVWGAVQVPQGGEPIVLMAEHPTTGGYPVIACVATVDFGVLGQLGFADGCAPIRFIKVSKHEALALYRERERRLDEVFGHHGQKFGQQTDRQGTRD